MDSIQFDLAGYNDGKHQFTLTDGAKIEGYILNFFATRPSNYFYVEPKKIFDYRRCKMCNDVEGMLESSSPFDIDVVQSAVKLNSGYTEIK
ncbi:MAG: hypothetical protein HRT71_10795 [Flavobacteriales bacterium]|nr:hypothetical protein [Flavobacteriales bacterium]